MSWQRALVCSSFHGVESVHVHGDESRDFTAIAEHNWLLLAFGLIFLACLVGRRVYFSTGGQEGLTRSSVRASLVGLGVFLLALALAVLASSYVPELSTDVQSRIALPLSEIILFAIALAAASKASGSGNFIMRTLVGVVLVVFLTNLLNTQFETVPTLAKTAGIVISASLATSPEVFLALLRGAASVLLTCFFLPDIRDSGWALLVALAMVALILVVELACQERVVVPRFIRRRQASTLPLGEQ